MSEIRVSALRIAMLVMVIGFSSMTHLHAQIEKGSFEIGIAAGPMLFIASGGHETVGGFLLSVEPHVDYSLTDELTAGATGFFYASPEHDPSQPAIYFGGVYGHVNYHFNSGGTWSPYVGGRIGAFIPDSKPLFAFGVQTGLQYFVTRQFSINGQLEIGACTPTAGVVLLSCLSLGLSYHIK